ncbi:uncharacterized protein LOC126749577 [Anthonomus grandis grandis]|uniref:uncharacterized protein LOC126749577 n=1 Tax=Anthonomus grandis grandis TaxID=2921223 RepID=UPI0021660CA6|nr:uncharacterized protein LOC126749577 [Anthonomus grandis grandis]
MHKLIISLSMSLVISSAEPVRWRSSPRFAQRQEVAPAQWKPSMDLNGTPPAPPASYGPPPPAPSYGPPPAPQEEPSSLTTTTEISITTEGNSESVDAVGGGEGHSGKLVNGHYYIYHPSGLLQKVYYASNNDDSRMSLAVKLKYEDVEPIRAPVYTYDPETYVLRKVFDPLLEQ